MKVADNPSALQDAQNAEKSAIQLYQKSRLAQKRLRTLLKFLPDPVFAFTRNKKIEYINPAFESVFGWTLKDVKGKTIKFIPDHLMDQAKQG
ncbi:MAG: PAS domain-containing protein, partial [Desulfobacula sp.]|nr:PAS domain-containing protein [Desulfobacula sp.]